MLSMINDDIKASMDALGDELKQYLKEAGETFPEDEAKKAEEEKEKKAKLSNSLLEPFIGVFGGLKEVVTAFGGGIRPAGKQSLKKQLTGGKSDVKLVLEIDAAKTELKSAIYGTYHNYKKMHGMLTW